nr:IclR family transcriptional regulator [Micromonospora sp. DSM 115978]
MTGRLDGGATAEEAPVTARSDLVNTLVHGLAILEMFSDERPVVAVSQMATQIGVHRSNASRLAATLHTLGFLSRAAGAGQYRLGPRLIRLGRLAGKNNDLVQQALGPLRALVEQTGETGHVGVLDGTEAVTVAVVDGWHTVRMHSQLNKRSPAFISSIGKALLAGLDDVEVRNRFGGRRLTALTPHTITSVPALLRELEQVRQRGYAVDTEELELGLSCVAAPIRDGEGRVVAALGLSGPALRLTGEALAELAEPVRVAAAQASAAIGGAPAPARPVRPRRPTEQKPAEQTPAEQTPAG